MTAKRILVAAAALMLVLGVSSGCAGTRPGVATSPGASASSGATESSATTGSIPGTGTGDAAEGGGSGSNRDVTGADLAAIEKQLRAMQSELDGLTMPNDNDFSGAEGAVY